MPERVDQRMDYGRGKNGPGFAPGPSIEEPGDRRQYDVAPIREAHVGDVREAKQDRCRPPARVIVLGRSGQHILQQTAKQEFFGPRRETQNG